MKTTIESIVEQFRKHPEYFEGNIKDLPELISHLDTSHDSLQAGFTVQDVKGFVAMLIFALENTNGPVQT